MHPAPPGEMLAGPGPLPGADIAASSSVPTSDWSIVAPGGHQCAAAALPCLLVLGSNISRPSNIQDFLLSLEAISLSASPGSLCCAPCHQ